MSARAMHYIRSGFSHTNNTTFHQFSIPPHHQHRHLHTNPGPHPFLFFAHNMLLLLNKTSVITYTILPFPREMCCTTSTQNYSTRSLMSVSALKMASWNRVLLVLPHERLLDTWKKMWLSPATM